MYSKQEFIEAMEKAMGPDHSKPAPFDYHNCAYCKDGKEPCKRGNAHGCEYLHARND